MKLLIFKSREPAFETMDRSCRKAWLKKVQRPKNVGVDLSVSKYIAHKYPDITVHYKDPFLANLDDYDAVYVGLEYWSMSHVLHEQGSRKLNQYKRLLNSIPKRKMIVPPAFIEFSHDKCAFNKTMRKLKIPVAPTKCVLLSRIVKNVEQRGGDLTLQNVFDSVRRTPWGSKGQEVFAKPMPGEGSRDIFSFTGDSFNDFKKSMRSLMQPDKKTYTHVVFQRFMPDFATDKHPEMRTYWVGDKYHFGVRTTDFGYYAGRIKRLPSAIRNHTQTMIRHFEKVYGFEFVCARFDWGFDKDIGYFMNEIELFPGFFNEEMSEKNLPKCKWDLDARIGDKIASIMSKKQFTRK